MDPARVKANNRRRLFECCGSFFTWPFRMHRRKLATGIQENQSNKRTAMHNPFLQDALQDALPGRLNRGESSPENPRRPQETEFPAARFGTNDSLCR